MRNALLLLVLGTVVCACQSGDAVTSAADQEKLRAALNKHEDPRAHGVVPGANKPDLSKGAANDFLAARRERMEAVKAGQKPAGLGAPPTR